MRLVAATFFVSVLAGPVSGQSPAPAPAFTAADVHPAPRRSYPFYFSVVLPENRLVMRDATMLDLISTAYDLDSDNVQGGPSWLQLDRFDVIAKVPPGTSKADQKLMLRALLTDRFHLTLHNGTAPMPAYVLSPGKEKPRFKAAEGTGDPACEGKDQPPATGPKYAFVSCHNMTMDAFAQQLRQMAGGYLDKPVVNSTGLEGAWDFDLKWSGRGNLAKDGPDGISIFDAVDKQLGLKLALETAPRPVVLVDGANRQPTANAADLEKTLPPQTLPQFEVATIKPSKPGEHGSGDISGNGVNITNIRLKEMVDLAWDLNEADPEVLVNAPKWLADERFDIMAKVSPESTGRPFAGGGNLPMDIYEVEEMLRALLIERFQIKAHMEERPIDAYTLTAANPKMKPADPAARTLCKEGPGPDGKDPRTANPMLNRLVTCTNMSMPEISDELTRIAGGYIFSPVLDATGVKGSFDFTLSFSSADRMPHNTTTAAPAGDPDTAASVPNGAVSVFDAVNHQLGLKLEKQKRPLPVLVIDHIEQKPTEN